MKLLRLALSMSAAGPLWGEPCDSPYPRADVMIETHTEWARSYYPKRIRQFVSDPLLKGDFVLLGDSLTELNEDWGEMLEVADLRNRGIRGDTSEGVLARLDELLCSEPRCVVLMIGTNDLWSDLSPVDVKVNIVEITRVLEDGLPDARLIVQTILPTRQGEKINRRVKAINHLLRSHDWESIELVDTYREFSNEKGDLKKELTTDGVHLNDLGYKRWVGLLKDSLH